MLRSLGKYSILSKILIMQCKNSSVYKTFFQHSDQFKLCSSKLENQCFDEKIFGGIHIRSDTFNYPYLDRVMPILDEEQIFMCWQMKHLLKKGSLVLDVGTGSGIFGIWAAKHGCKVIAIDINPRALAMAKYNINNNQIKSAKNIENLEEGSILLIDKRFDNNFIKDYLEKFDLVFLSPPYHPTCPQSVAAFHAEAGIDGQSVFEEQIRLVPSILKIGGKCIGNQLTPVNHQGVHALLTIENAFYNYSQKCFIRYCDILNSEINTYNFLKGIYQSFLVPNPNVDKFNSEQNCEFNHPSADDFKQYIEMLSKQYPKFAFIYYEVTKDLSESPKKIGQDEFVFIPNTTWEARIHAHRMVAEQVKLKIDHVVQL